MRPFSLFPLFVLVLAGELTLGFSGVQASDKVTLINKNEVILGRIRKCDIDGIEIEITERTGQAVKRSLRIAEVADIEWTVQDREFNSGVAAFRGGSYGAAAQRLSGIVEDAESMQAFRPEVKPYLYYLLGESLYRGGKAAEAVPVFTKLLNEFSKSYYVPQAVGSLVDAAIITKDFAKVPALLNTLRGLGDEQKALADYYEGQMQFAQDKIKEAEAKYVASERAASTPGTKGLALMGQARCAVANKDLAKARALATNALKTDPPPSVAGAAYIVIGEALLSEVDSGKADNAEARLMDAALAFLRVTDFYSGHPSTEPLALLRAGETFQRLSKLPNRGADRSRAIAMYNRLLEDNRYKNSRWAQQAQENMKPK